MDGDDPPAGDGDGAADAVAAGDGSFAGFRSALADVVSPREAALAGAVAAGLRGRARDVRELGSGPPGEILRALRRSVAGLAAAARPGGSSSRLAVALALVVVASGTLTLVGSAPAAAILGDNERTTYTLDVGEIQLEDGGKICATPVGDDTYRVLITDATLVDTTVYQQRGDDAVKTDLPTLEVDDAIVMYTGAEDEDFDLLATTMGCTDEDQTSRTVFRNRYQTGSMLRGSEGLTMVNMQSTDGAVPEPGGFQFVAPDENGSSSSVNVSDGVDHVADDVDDVLDDSLADRLENGTDGGLGVNETAEGVDETVGNATDGPAGADTVEDATGNATDATGESVSTVGETAANTTRDTVENATREVADDDPPENVSGTVDGTTDAVDTTTGEVENTTDDVTDATDEVANSTGDDTTSTVVDDTTDVVDGTTETVTNTTDAVTDGVDDTTDQVVRPVEETATPDDTSTPESTETSEPTPSPTEAPITPTDVLTPTPTPEDEPPAWLDRVDDDERTSVLETVEETDGGFESVENVTEETDGYSEETIDGDENLTRLDNGTVLLLNGTDADTIDWGTVEDTLDTDLTSTDDSETEATTSETDDGSGSDDDGTLFG